MILHGRIRTGSDWWFSKILWIRTGSDSILSDQDWTRTGKFHSPLISAPPPLHRHRNLLDSASEKTCRIRLRKSKLRFLSTSANTEYLKCIVANSPVALRWMCDPPRTGCARKTTKYIRGAVVCRGLVMPEATAWLDAVLPNSSIEQWCMLVIVTGYTLFVTSQYDVIFTFANQRFCDISWHNMHIQGRRSSGRAGGAVKQLRAI